MFSEVDVSEWERSGHEPLGSKTKSWLEDPSSVRWLFKAATFNPRSGGSRYRKGDDWSERVATEVSKALGLPTAVTELAVLKGDDGDVSPGVISRSMLAEGESLIHGNELLAEIDVPVDHRHGGGGYRVERVKDSLDGIDPPSGIELPGFGSWDFMVGYLVLDALIGNTDRHAQNWAVLAVDVPTAGGPGGRRLAPTFDHASSLGFLLDDEERRERLSTKDRNRTVEKFARRAGTRFVGKPHPIDVALDALSMCDRRVRVHWLERVRELEGIEVILARLPPHRASDVAREFATQLFAVNRERFLSEGLGTL